MNTLTIDVNMDQEYLQHDLIPNITYNINDDTIRVSSPDTCYCSINRPKTEIFAIDFDYVYKQIIKKAKQKGISISYKNKYKQAFYDNFDMYHTEFFRTQQLFKKIANGYKEIEKRGLHYGTMNDQVLHSVEKLQHEYTACFWRTTALSKITEIYRQCKDTLEDIELSNDQKTVTKIYI